MNILLLSLIFSPDNVSTAQLMAATAEELSRRGHRLAVITTSPHSHRDASMEASQPLRIAFPLLGRFIQRSDFAGIPVYHIWVPNKTCFPPLRVLSWLWFHAFGILLALCLRFKPNVILACSPPITIGLMARITAALTRSRYVYNVQELYPDIAVHLGILKNPFLIRCVSCVERMIYAKASAVTSITPAMCAKIQARTDPEKVHLIPNFADIPSPEELNARSAPPHAGLVVTYAGNMGVPQNLGALVEAVARTEGVTVRLIGEGADRPRLQSLAQTLGVLGSKVLFEPYQPLTAMPRIYAESDLFYVAQSPDACSDGIPSKIYRILGNRKPILALSDPASDLAQFVRQTGGGVVVDVANPDALVDALNALARDPSALEPMAEKGYNAISASFSRKAVTDRLGALLESLVR